MRSTSHVECEIESERRRRRLVLRCDSIVSNRWCVRLPMTRRCAHMVVLVAYAGDTGRSVGAGVHDRTGRGAPRVHARSGDAVRRRSLSDGASRARAGERVNRRCRAWRATAYLPRLDSLWQSNRATANNIFGQVLPQSVIPAMSGPVLPSASGQSVWGSATGALFSWEPFDFGLRDATVVGRGGGGHAGACGRSADAARRPERRRRGVPGHSGGPARRDRGPGRRRAARRARAHGPRARRQSAATRRRSLACRRRTCRGADAAHPGTGSPDAGADDAGARARHHRRGRHH